MNEGRAPDAGQKARLLTLDQLDGRTIAAKNAKALIEALESDLGGSDRITSAQRQIVQRASLAAVMIESMEAAWLTGQTVDVSKYSALVNMQRRLLATIGLERRAKDVTPDLQRYIASRAAPVPPPPGPRP